MIPTLPYEVLNQLVSFLSKFLKITCEVTLELNTVINHSVILTI